MDYQKHEVNVDPFPFRVREVRLAYPGTLNGEPTIFDPRPEYDTIYWEEIS